MLRRTFRINDISGQPSLMHSRVNGFDGAASRCSRALLSILATQLASGLRFACLRFSLNHSFACAASAGTRGVLHFEFSCNGSAPMNCIGQCARELLGKLHLTLFFCRLWCRLGACAITRHWAIKALHELNSLGVVQSWPFRSCKHSR